MEDSELLARIHTLILNADTAIDLLEDPDCDDSSEAVDIDYDVYQEIHKLFRLDGRLKGEI